MTRLRREGIYITKLPGKCRYMPRCKYTVWWGGFIAKQFRRRRDANGWVRRLKRMLDMVQSTNKSVMSDHKFISGCRKANIKPTERQARKWRNKTGKAYRAFHDKGVNDTK
jgi:hypothetical protein